MVKPPSKRFLLLCHVANTRVVLTSPPATPPPPRPTATTTVNLLLLLLLLHDTITAAAAAAPEESRGRLQFSFPSSFSQSQNQSSSADASVFNFSSDSSGIQAGALQVTFDTVSQSVDVASSSGQITYGTPLLLWDPAYNYIASFNTSFLISIIRPSQVGDMSSGGGMTFFLSPVAATHLPDSSGAFLGLPRSSSFVAVEFDTFKDPFDPDNNHVGVDIGSTMSALTQPLDSKRLALDGTDTSVWIDYDGQSRKLDVYLAQNGPVLGTKPSFATIADHSIDLRQYLPQKVYFGFSASTGTSIETHSVLRWDFSYVGFPTSGTSTRSPNPGSPSPSSFKAFHGIALGLGLLVATLLVAALFILILLRKRKKKAENLLQDLASLNYGPRRFEFKALKKATKGFSAECKLGQGGFGAVYRGELWSGGGRIQVAVKCLSQNSSQGQKEFRAEIKSMGRMRHKNLVQLLGWELRPMEREAPVGVRVHAQRQSRSMASSSLPRRRLCGWIRARDGVEQETPRAQRRRRWASIPARGMGDGCSSQRSQAQQHHAGLRVQRATRRLRPCAINQERSRGNPGLSTRLLYSHVQHSWDSRVHSTGVHRGRGHNKGVGRVQLRCCGHGARNGKEVFCGEPALAMAVVRGRQAARRR